MEVASPRYDLIVIGGGPAGCACAITAARSVARVLLLESGQFPRHKVCGEFVSPESLAILDHLLGPEAHRLVAAAPRISTARIFLDGSEIAAPISPPAASITRYALDIALWEAARNAGVDCKSQTVVESIHRDRGTFIVKVADAQFASRAVVNATGRWSRLARRVLRDTFAADKGPRWLGIKAHFLIPDDGAHPAPSCDLYFFPGGYCGVQPIGPSRVNACAMVRADIASSLHDVFTKHPALAARASAWRPLMAPVTTSPLIFAPVVPEEDGVLLAGDAAGFVDPFTGDGISLALRSGTLAAESLAAFFRDDISLDDAASTYARLHRDCFHAIYRNAARFRRAVEAPRPVRAAFLHALRIPALARLAVAATRGA